MQTGLMPLSASGDLSAFAIRPYLCVWPSRLATWPQNTFRDRAGLACKSVCRRLALRAVFCVRRPAVPVRLAFPPRGLTSECFSPPRGACLQTGLPLSASGGLLRAHGCLACVCGTRLQLRQQPQRRCRHVSHAVRGHFPASKRHPAAAPKPRHVPALCCGLPAAKPCGVSTRRAVLPFSGALRLRARLPSLSLTEKA